MQESYTINLPLSIRTHKREKNNKFYLNLNIYRNAHFHTLNKAKELFTELVSPLVKHIPKIRKTDIIYTLFTGSKTLVDVSNICCIVDKFFCDTLVENHILVDDNLEFISDIHYSFGSIDKQNPRVEATLTNIIFEEDISMRIVIEEHEIKQAIETFIRNQITVKEGQNIEIALKAGRGENGFSADIDIVSGEDTSSLKGQSIKQTEKVTESIPDAVVQEDPSGLKKLFDDVPVVKADVSEPTEPFAAAAEGTALKAENTAQQAGQQLMQKETIATSAPTATEAPKSLFAGLTKLPSTNQ